MNQGPAYTYVHAASPSCYVNAVAAHPCVPQLASAGDDGRLVCWDAASQRPLWESALSLGGLFDVRYTASGEHVIVAGAGKAGIKCLRASDGRQAWSTQRRDRSGWGFTSAMVDPQERVLVAAPGDTRFVQVYALPKRAHELDVGQACLRVVFSPDGKRVATAGEGAVKIWNPFGKRRGPSRLYLPPTWTLEVDGAVVTDVAFAPDGGTCATASSDGVLRIWPAERRDGRPHPTHALAFDATPQAVAYSPDGALLAVGDARGRVTWVDTGRPRVVEEQEAHEHGVCRLTFTPSGAWLVTAGADGRASLWTPPIR